MSTKNLQVDLNFEADVFTQESATKLVISIFEYLLFQRNQIPFDFRIFKYLISRWKIDEEDDNGENLIDFNVERQRQLARTTLDGIKELTNNISAALEEGKVLSMRFLFGSTSLTPKEAYIVKIPPISKKHSTENHRHSDETLIKQILMSLLTSEELFILFSNNLSQTNVFLEIEMETAKDYCSNKKFFLKEFGELPPSCSTAVINIIHKRAYDKDCSNLDCCKDLKVFQDIANITLEDRKEEDKETILDHYVGWWESNSFVRGYKDKMIKGTGIWQN